MELILVRHARPEHVVGAPGPADPALTDIGHRQARAMAEWMAAEAIDALYSSPMTRARQTADPLSRAAGLATALVDGVREYDAEDSSYVPLEVLRQDKALWRHYLAGEAALDRSHFVTGVVSTLDDLVAAHRGQRIVVVCHGGVINAWASHVLRLTPQLFFNPDYTSVNRFLVAGSGERSVLSLNETAHLRDYPDLRL
jgi:probable phosphoglycerate mutase